MDGVVIMPKKPNAYYTKSLIIPIYKNRKNIPSLLIALDELSEHYHNNLEVVFVVDGSPDDSYELLEFAIKKVSYCAQLIALSRNFGSFTAIRTGMEAASGEFVAVLAADLQEPPELIKKFFSVLEKDEADIVFGKRTKRNDPWMQKILASIYWAGYRRFIIPEMPAGGVDVFGCNQLVRNAVLSIKEPNSSLIAQLFWVGFRRRFEPYVRRARKEGKSSWGLRKRFRYMMDSILSYSDLPIVVVLWAGALGLALTFLLGGVTILGKVLGFIDVPGYTALVLVNLFFGSALLVTQGIIGSYMWRTFENTKKRPLSIIADRKDNQ